MADSIKKTLGAEIRYTFTYDQPPTIKEMLDTLKAIDAADRQAVIKRVVSSNDQELKAPVRFVFTLDSSSDVDVPIP